MYQLRKKRVSYEDLLRELEGIEQQLLGLDSSLSMDLMVLEAKIRDRFQKMEQCLMGRAAPEDELGMGEKLTLEDIKALIPKDLPEFPSLDDITETRKTKRTLGTVGLAAALAIATALCVVGMASAIQFGLTWLI